MGLLIRKNGTKIFCCLVGLLAVTGLWSSLVAAAEDVSSVATKMVIVSADVFAGNSVQANTYDRTRNWYNTVLHSHSQYSDGNLSVRSLMTYAAFSGCAAIAITDHCSLDQCSDPYFQPTFGTIPIRGEEWTTLSGHANVLNPTGDLSFCEEAGDSIELMITSALNRNGTIVVNHPFYAEGWTHDYLDEGISGIEVWNIFWFMPPQDSAFAANYYCAADFIRQNCYLTQSADVVEQVFLAYGLTDGMFDNFPNIRALAWWQGFLEQGRMVSAVGGADFHYFPVPLLFPLSYVAAPSNSAEDIVQAVADGHLIITHDWNSPKVFVYADDNGDGFYESIVGDNLQIAAATTIRFRIEVVAGEGKRVHLVTSQGLQEERIVGSGNPWVWELQVQANAATRDFVRAEVRSLMLSDYMLSLTNPIYINY